MNLVSPPDDLIEVTCPTCAQRGRLRAGWRGEWVRCKRCLGQFEVPPAGVRLGISRAVPAPRAGVAARAATLGVASPAADERVTPPLRVFNG